MAYVTDDQIRAALTPFLGSEVALDTSLCAELGEAMRSFVSFRETYDDLAEHLQSIIFNTLYETLGERMTLRLDNGQNARIRMSDIPVIADEALGVMFDHLDVYLVTFTKLKEYSMRSGSLSAMRVLYQKYSSYQTPEEQALMIRIIKESNPPERYRSWLHETDDLTPEGDQSL